MTSMRWLADRGVTAPAGFRAGAAAGGLKASGRPDVALVVSEQDCAAAGLFTRNLVKAAPVILDQALLASDPAHLRAVVVNAGNANACTGERGHTDARAMQALAAEAVGCAPHQVLVLSTGVIGRPMDLAAVAKGVAGATAALSPEGHLAAAEAIMTTDTRPKQGALAVTLSGGTVTLGGMAKGSGMIHPDLATMLVVITTDLGATPAELQTLLAEAVDRSFHCITVDGDTSTNDSVLLLASGASGQGLATDGDRAAFAEGLHALTAHLAREIVRDGEGASRFVTLTVEGAPTDADARQVARTVATSPLVKTAFAGGDPNWGRILAAAGRAGVPFDPATVALTAATSAADLDDAATPLLEGGQPVPAALPAAAAVFASPVIFLRLSLHAGPGRAEVWTCDLTHDYVRINADYTT